MFASTATSSTACFLPDAKLATSIVVGSSFTSLSSFAKRDLSDMPRVTSNSTPMQKRYTPGSSRAPAARQQVLEQVATLALLHACSLE